jgi:ADP-ribose pyrophosphatase YjhB (NUDIX family)
MQEDHGIVAIIKKENKFLLIKESRKLLNGFWAPPHEICEKKDNSEEETVMRGVLEEVGLHTKPIKPLWTTKADTKIKTVSFWLVELKSQDIKANPREVAEYGWFTVDEALKLDLFPGTRIFFSKLKSKEIQI